MIARLSLIAVLVFGVAACDPAASPPPPMAATPAPEPAPAATPAANSASDLAGTSWQLVKISGSDGTTHEPAERANYTIEFQSDGSIVARIDCNRGRGTWKSAAPGQLQLGPLATTRMMCPEGSLDSRVTTDWDAVRSYAIKDGRLLLSLSDGRGTYEYEPAPHSEQ